MSVKLILDFCKKNNIPCRQNELLAKHCTFKVGGKAKLYCVPDTTQQFCTLITLCREQSVPFYILGKGSNVLFSDEGYNGVVLSTLALTDISVNENNFTAQCGTPLAELCKVSAQKGYSGLEFAYGIPGTVGGAVYMNAGAYGGEIKNVLTTATYLLPNGKLELVSADMLQLGYRTSLLQKNDGILVEASFSLKKGDTKEIWENMRGFAAKRVEKQPVDKPSAGSTFKRPEGAFAGALIENSGLKGFRIGDAAVSEKHCGFIVNLGHATSKDILSLVQEVKRIVKEKTGYLLEEEIRVIREFSDKDDER